MEQRVFTFDDVQATLVLPPRVRRIAYLTEPVKVLPGLTATAARYDCALVSVFGMRWEDDLTPWPAPKAFRRGRDFGGRAERFLQRLLDEVLPVVETGLAVEQRLLVGLSLGGLFALWTACRCAAFCGVGAVSASLWYAGFLEWLAAASPQARCAYLSLGAEERNARLPLFAAIEEQTRAAARLLREKGVATQCELVPGNHFSDGVGRLRRALIGLSENCYLCR